MLLLSSSQAGECRGAGRTLRCQSRQAGLPQGLLRLLLLPEAAGATGFMGNRRVCRLPLLQGLSWHLPFVSVPLLCSAATAVGLVMARRHPGIELDMVCGSGFALGCGHLLLQNQKQRKLGDGMSPCCQRIGLLPPDR